MGKDVKQNKNKNTFAFYVASLMGENIIPVVVLKEFNLEKRGRTTNRNKNVKEKKKKKLQRSRKVVWV